MSESDEAVEPRTDHERLIASEAWLAAVAWFALIGPLNDHQRIPMSTLLEAEEANPWAAA